MCTLACIMAWRGKCEITPSTHSSSRRVWRAEGEIGPTSVPGSNLCGLSKGSG